MKVSETLPEPISWERAKDITTELFARLNDLSEETIKALDAQDGVYVVSYDGSALSIGFDAGKKETKVVYVGISKFNSSRHFQNGSTGTSTLRRSLGAMLSSWMDLLPIPRSSDANDADRYNNYAFDAESEEELTSWMKNNFKIAYLQLKKEEIESVYLGLINYNVPIFNFQHNPENKYGSQIKIARKKCAEEATANDLNA